MIQSLQFSPADYTPASLCAKPAKAGLNRDANFFGEFYAAPTLFPPQAGGPTAFGKLRIFQASLAPGRYCAPATKSPDYSRLVNGEDAQLNRRTGADKGRGRFAAYAEASRAADDGRLER